MDEMIVMLAIYSIVRAAFAMAALYPLYQIADWVRRMSSMYRVAYDDGYDAGRKEGYYEVLNNYRSVTKGDAME